MNYKNKVSATQTATGSTTIALRHFANGGVGIQITGITSATVTFEATIDDTNWVAHYITPVASATQATTTTTDGIFFANVVGISQFRARISTYGSGTIVTTMVANPG